MLGTEVVRCEREGRFEVMRASLQALTTVRRPGAAVGGQILPCDRGE